jgi:alpha-galactosidase
VPTSVVVVVRGAESLHQHQHHQYQRQQSADSRSGSSQGQRYDDAAGGLFATPPLGWNAWNAFHCDVSERLIIAMADAMANANANVTTLITSHPPSQSLPPPSLRAAGYRYLNLDDCWMVDRDATDGSVTADPVRFPSGIKALADYVHSKGLLFGIYTAPGSNTPQGRPGLLGHEAQDVATFCDWGVDYLKLDSRGSTRDGWEKVRTAINKCDHPMFLQVAFCKSVDECEGWMDGLANSWRTSGDAQATWASVMVNVDATEPLYPLAGPTGPIGGHWNDADLLEAGNVGLSDVEVRSQIALWSFMNVPILLSDDLRRLTYDPDMATTMALLTNPGMLALNQDPLGYQGRRVSGGPGPSPSPPIHAAAATVAKCDPENDAQRWYLVPALAPAPAPALAGAGASGGSSGTTTTAATTTTTAATTTTSISVVHSASGLALGAKACWPGARVAKASADLALSPPGEGANCTVNITSGGGGGVGTGGGLRGLPLVGSQHHHQQQMLLQHADQVWTLQPNGSVTSALDGSCLDVFEHANPVVHHCIIASLHHFIALQQRGVLAVARAY